MEDRCADGEGQGVPVNRIEARLIAYADRTWVRPAPIMQHLAVLLAPGDHPDLGTGRASRFVGWLWCHIARIGLSAVLRASVCLDVATLWHPLYLDTENERFQRVLLELRLRDIQLIVADMPVVHGQTGRSE